MFKGFLFVFFYGLLSAHAESTYRFEIYGSSTFQEVNNKSNFNPDNESVEVPIWTHVAELRPDIQLNFLESQSFVIRSRHSLAYTQVQQSNPERFDETTEGKSDLSDFFLTSNWSDGISATLGLQNYQWGPAEIYSPTNPFFHFNNNQRGFFYKEKGHVLVRTNWNPSANWSIVGLYEPMTNKESFWTADKSFVEKGLVKIERQGQNPANSAAIVLGSGEDRKAFFGEYFNWSPTEGVSFYADVSHKPRTNYVPAENGLGGFDMVEAPKSEDFLTLGVFGFRWEGRVDFRQEFIWNEAGYDSYQWEAAKLSAITLAPQFLKNVKRFVGPGLEFKTQSYSYTSIRVPDLGKSNNTSIAFRWIASLTEDSSVLQFNYEYNWSDSTVLSAEWLEFLGQRDTEFRTLTDRQVSLGFRWSY